MDVVIYMSPFVQTKAQDTGISSTEMHLNGGSLPRIDQPTET